MIMFPPSDLNFCSSSSGNEWPDRILLDLLLLVTFTVTFTVTFNVTDHKLRNCIIKIIHTTWQYIELYNLIYLQQIHMFWFERCALKTALRHHQFARLTLEWEILLSPKFCCPLVQHQIWEFCWALVPQKRVFSLKLIKYDDLGEYGKFLTSKVVKSNKHYMSISN